MSSAPEVVRIAKVQRAPEGYVDVVLTAGSHLDLPGALELNDALRRLMGSDYPRPFLVDITPPHRTDPAVRRFASEVQTAELIERLVLLVRTPVARMLGNAFLMARRPPFPVRLFSERERAVQWLLGGRRNQVQRAVP